MKHIRIGLVGAGFMGKTHLWSVRNLPFFYKTADLGCTAEVAVVCASTPARGEVFAREYGIPRVMTAEEMIADPEIDVIAGNIATSEAAIALRDAGAHAVKVGIGPGSICTTRVVCGVGIPQLTAIYNARKALQGSIPVIGDGGIKLSGDVPKAIVAGADSVMLGSVLAGTEESPGEKIISGGRQYVAYRGMGSLGALKNGKGSRARYFQDNEAEDDLVPQGIEGMVPYSGPAHRIMTQFCGGLSASLGYCGCRTIAELQEKGKFYRVTANGVREAHPHDITITKEAPNYRT